MTPRPVGRVRPGQTVRRGGRVRRRPVRFWTEAVALVAALALVPDVADALPRVPTPVASAPAAAAPTATAPVVSTPAPPPPAAVAPAPAAQTDLGPDVYVFTPDMPESQIQSTVDSIAHQQIPAQFGTQRYALLFAPGTYGSAADPLSFQVGYYTQVAGLGRTPGAVTINGSINVYNQCFPTTDGASNCIALDNFWRSLSDLTINIMGQTGCHRGADFWAVSQAAPMRRVDITGGNLSLQDYCSAGPQYASGGFIADSAFSGGTVVSGAQQQFIVRNSALDGWSNGVWNQVFSGDTGAPTQSFSATSGLPGGTNPYTTLATSPVSQDEPFLQTDGTDHYSVFVPALQHDSSGPAWMSGPEAGTSIPISKFFIATPATAVAAMDTAVRLGRDLILTPGIYNLKAPILITRPDTVVLGLGFPTLIPRTGTPAMQVVGGRGVKLSGMIFQAGPINSPVLLQLGGPSAAHTADPDDPALVQDVFFRIGGAAAGEATDSLVVDSSDVILDDIWAWRADHGRAVGWKSNRADHGLTVNGDNVTAYGLFVEHYQRSQVIWNGQNGRDIFFQNEMPYDPPSQAAWRQNPTAEGYPAFQLGADVTSFQGYGMGSYCYFDQGASIEASAAFEVPRAPGVQLHDVMTKFLSGSGGIQSVVDGTGGAVSTAHPGPSDVVTYPQPSG